MSPDDTVKARMLIRHLNKAYFKDISMAEAVELTGLIKWFAKSIEESESKKPAKKSGVKNK